MTERVLTPAEVGAALRVSRNTMYSLIASGGIRHVRVGEGRNAAIRVPESAVTEFLAGNRGNERTA